ncbi:MAG: hypothetical protein INR72_15535 [Williamsia herbipolensis]|nr:hypothetical protein [Williamsia herbipolensis]
MNHSNTRGIGTVLALTSDGTRAAVEWENSYAGFSDVRLITRVGRRIDVTIQLGCAVCSECDTAYGIPLYLDGQPHHCPLGHRNEPAPAGEEADSV